jgi:hypothetical protein
VLWLFTIKETDAESRNYSEVTLLFAFLLLQIQHKRKSLNYYIMAEIKTKVTDSDVDKYLGQIEPEKRRKDSLVLKKLFDSALKEKAALWNNNMIGYGAFHYKSDRSSQQGDWPLIAFSPRKQNITVYIMSGAKNYQDLLGKLGKHKISGGSCIYINKVEDIDLAVLSQLISASVADMKSKYKIK